MGITKDNLTVIILTLKSQKIIDDCLKSIDPDVKKIVVENSSDEKFIKSLEKKYQNIECYVTGSNLGMGTGNNFRIKKSKTRYVMILNPDTILKNNTIDDILKGSQNIEFSIISPLSDDKNFPNYKIFKGTKSNENLFEVDSVDGYAMILDKTKFNENFFDEKIFMYLENSDLCLRMIKQNQKVYIVSKAKIFHLGGKAVEEKFSKEVELSRNWHWMWSKYYFNKKHFGSIRALSLIFINLFSSSFKWFLFFITFKKNKKIKYKMRTCGLVSSILGKSSFYRPKIN